MTDTMQPIPFRNLLHWIADEYRNQQSVFSIPAHLFYRYSSSSSLIFNENCRCPVGPAAGPHTQLARNCITAFITGARFIELKTVQNIDTIEIEKPCIDAEDVGYNTEWSTELTVSAALHEYIKAWILVHLLTPLFSLAPTDEPGCVFTMSVGYDLAGIKSEKINTFIDTLKEAKHNTFFQQSLTVLYDEITNGLFDHITDRTHLIPAINALPTQICSSVTLSTMHGCPPEDIEAICRYLLDEKGLHTYVKLNPTLLGHGHVRSIFNSLGFTGIHLDQDTFSDDLQYSDALAMLTLLQQSATTVRKQFGVKLSNTLAVKNSRSILPGNEMYLSGRTLFPLTVNLAARLSEDMQEALPVSFSGGASIGNITSLFRAGIRSVSLATDLLKPGGYSRLNDIIETVTSAKEHAPFPDSIDIPFLRQLADSATTDPCYAADRRRTPGMKISELLPLLDCYTAPCRHTCPINQDIPRYIRLVEEERYSDACAVILDRNPLPHITGNICDHQCMQKCTRHDYDTPVEIRALKRIAAEQGFDDCIRNYSTAITANNIPVAIIGAGPAGLTTAFFLARAGFSVSVFEKELQTGGIVRNVIPGFRLPREAIEKDCENIAQLGVTFHFGQQPHFSIAELHQEGFTYICLAIGAGKSIELPLAGDNPHIYSAIDFLWQSNGNPQGIVLGSRVAVVGGGNSAMDGARAALRTEGVEKVYILYRRTQEFMPADREEFDNAIQDGIIYRELISPVSFSTDGILTCQVMELGDPDASGRKRPVPVSGKCETFAVDSVISAIGEKVDAALLSLNNIRLNGSRVIANPDTLETNLPAVFIAGDARRGPSTVVESIADGRMVAEAICTAAAIPFPSESTVTLDECARIGAARTAQGRIITDSPKPDSPQTATAEARRCLACDIVCEKCVQDCPNRANVAIQVPAGTTSFKNVTQILHIDGLCNECGNCQTFCPWLGSPYTDKLTLFWTESAFRESTNSGFLLPPNPQDASVLLRIDGDEYRADLLPEKGVYGCTTETATGSDINGICELLTIIISDYPYLTWG